MDNRLLVVEDDPRYLALLAFRLKKAGFQVETAPGGEKAKRCFTESPTAIVVTDLVMPKVDGIALLDFVKKSRPETEVILLSGSGTIEGAVEAMRMGAFDFIVKPVEKGRLEGLVQYCFESIQRRQKSEIPFSKKDSDPESKKPIHNSLTKTEDRIVRLILMGMPDRKIAELLSISFHTVRSHVQNVFRKTDVRSRIELILLMK